MTIMISSTSTHALEVWLKSLRELTGANEDSKEYIILAPNLAGNFIKLQYQNGKLQGDIPHKAWQVPSKLSGLGIKKSVKRNVISLAQGKPADVTLVGKRDKAGIFHPYTAKIKTATDVKLFYTSNWGLRGQLEKQGFDIIPAVSSSNIFHPEFSAQEALDIARADITKMRERDPEADRLWKEAESIIVFPNVSTLKPLTLAKSQKIPALKRKLW